MFLSIRDGRKTAKIGLKFKLAAQSTRIASWIATSSHQQVKLNGSNDSPRHHRREHHSNQTVTAVKLFHPDFRPYPALPRRQEYPATQFASINWCGDSQCGLPEAASGCVTEATAG